MNQTQPKHTAIYQRIIQLCQQAGATFLTSRMSDPINSVYTSDSGEVEIIFDNGHPHEIRTSQGSHCLPFANSPNKDKFLALLNTEFEVTEIEPIRPAEITGLIQTGPVVTVKKKQNDTDTKNTHQPQTVLLPHQTTAFARSQTDLSHSPALEPGAGKTLSPDIGTKTFIRIVQIWQSVGAQYLRPKNPELNRHFPSSSGEIELVLDNKNPVMLRTPEGQYSLGGYSYNAANPDQFMQLLMNEFDIIEVEPKKPHNETHGSFTGPVIALIPKDSLSLSHQIKAISAALDTGKTVCIAVPNHSTKALIRREPIESQNLRIVGDHPDVTYFSNGAWLIFIYTTIQNTLKDRQFDIAYYVRGKDLTPMAQSCERENLTLLRTATRELRQLQLEIEPVTN